MNKRPTKKLTLVRQTLTHLQLGGVAGGLTIGMTPVGCGGYSDDDDTCGATRTFCVIGTLRCIAK